MKRVFPAIFFLIVTAALISCGTGGSSSTSAAIPNIAGTWEFLAVSSNGGGTTGIEVALQEGTVLISGMNQPNGQVAASGVNQIAFVCIDSTTGDLTSFGGNCSGESGTCLTSGANTLSGTAMATGGPFSFSYNENGNQFNVTGMLGSDDQSFVNGTYTSPSSTMGCVDSGSVTGLLVPKLTGVYVGNMTLPNQANPQMVTATFSESSGNLSASIVTAANVSFTMTGPVTGNAFVLQGQFSGQPVIFSGYREVTHNLPSVYFENSTNSPSAYAGTLTLQQVQ